MLSRSQPLQQRTPLKRSAWIRRSSEPKGPGLAQRIAEMLGFEIKHERAPLSVFRSDAHLRNVAGLNCVCCDRPLRSQAAHTNLLIGQKGMGIKASDALTFALCADGVQLVGCHSMLDQGGKYSKKASAAMQIHWIERTRMQLIQAGKWPAEAEADFQQFIVAYQERGQAAC